MTQKPGAAPARPGLLSFTYVRKIGLIVRVLSLFVMTEEPGSQASTRGELRFDVPKMVFDLMLGMDRDPLE